MGERAPSCMEGENGQDPWIEGRVADLMESNKGPCYSAHVPE